MAELTLFDRSPLLVEIEQQERYVNLLIEKRVIIKELIEFKEEGQSKEDSDSDLKVLLEEKLFIINSKQDLIALESEIASKQSFLRELKKKGLRDKAVLESQYQDYLKDRAQFFEKLNQITFKTDHHKHLFTYLRSELSSYEKWLKDVSSDSNSIESKTGIMEGVVHFYTQLLYAIQDHQKFRA